MSPGMKVLVDDEDSIVDADPFQKSVGKALDVLLVQGIAVAIAQMKNNIEIRSRNANGSAGL